MWVVYRGLEGGCVSARYRPGQIGVRGGGTLGIQVKL